MTNTKNLVLAVILTIVVSAAVLFFLFYSTLSNSVAQIIVTAPPKNSATNQSSGPTPTPNPNEPFGVLLLGFRGDGSKGGYLTDTIMVAYVEPEKKVVSLITIPRDLWVRLAVSETEERYYKINHAFAVGVDNRMFPNKLPQYQGPGGGGQLAKETVEEVTGLKIPYFVAINFFGFTKTIDTLGGVDVNVTKALEDKFFPIPGKEEDACGKSPEEMKALEATMSGYLLEQQYTCRYETLSFAPGLVKMDGATALKYARSRHSTSGGSDFSRSERQKQVMLSVKNKVTEVGFVPKALPFIQSLGGSLWTDVDSGVLVSFMPRINEFSGYNVRSISVSTENALRESFSNDRQYILIPTSGVDNYKSVQDYITAELSK